MGQLTADIDDGIPHQCQLWAVPCELSNGLDPTTQRQNDPL